MEGVDLPHLERSQKFPRATPVKPKLQRPQLKRLGLSSGRYGPEPAGSTPRKTRFESFWKGSVGR